MGFSDYVHLRKLIQLVTRWGKNFLRWRIMNSRTMGILAGWEHPALINGGAIGSARKRQI